jgi:hypothetical protein
MSSWKDTIQDDDGSAPVTSSSWRDTIQDDGPSIMDSALEIGKEFAAPVAEGAQDFSIGAAQGVTLGAADEIGGGLAALLEKGAGKLGFGPAAVDQQLEEQGFQVPGTSLADTYREYQQGSEQEFKDANERSPVLNTLGNIAGSATTGIAAGKALGIGNQAKNSKSAYDVYKSEGKLNAAADLLKKGATTFAKASPAIAAESALVSEGNFDNAESREKLGKDVIGGLAFGVPTVLGLEAATDLVAPAAKAGLNVVDDKFSKFVQNNPFMRKYGIGIKHGEMGTKPTTEAGLKNLENLQKLRTQGMVDNLYQTNDKLGKELGATLTNATNQGILIDTDTPLRKALNDLQFKPDKLEAIKKDTGARGQKILGKIQTFLDRTDVTPIEAKELLKDIDTFGGKFDNTRLKTQSDDDILDLLDSVRSNLFEQLKTTVPEYGEQAKRFAEFRNFNTDTILAGSTPVDYSKAYTGEMDDAVKDKLFNKLKEMQQGATAQGTGAKNGRDAYENLIKGMKEFEFREKFRNDNLIKQGKAPNTSPLVQSSNEFGQTMSKFSDEANFLKDVQTVKSPFVTGQNLVSTVGQMGHSGALSTSLIVGKVKKPIADISRKAYNMPGEKLNTLADQMISSPGLKVLGQALKEGLENGDQAKKNAAIFSILQNPESRLFFEGDEE